MTTWSIWFIIFLIGLTTWSKIKSGVESMDLDKRQMIMQAALEEFYLKGYEGASTNRMTKAAGVSKGILFHYFGDKRNLYLTVVDECLKHYHHILTSPSMDLSEDLFEAIEQLSEQKAEVFKSNPIMFGFIANTFMAMPEELKSDLKRMQQQMNKDSIQLLASRIDQSRFREGIDPERAIEFVLLSLESVVTKQMSGMYEDNAVGSGLSTAFDTKSYLDMLRYGIYRKEG